MRGYNYFLYFCKVYSKGKNQGGYFMNDKNIINAAGQLEMGDRYFYGKGLEKNYEQAVYWYTKAAEHDPEIEKNNVEQHAIFTARDRLVDCYLEGKGVKQDYYQAQCWYNEVVNWGYYGWTFGNPKMLKIIELREKQKQNKGVNPVLQLQMGDRYYIGEGVTQSYEKAIHWYRKAAEQGLQDAQHKLGYGYCNGEGVEQDFDQGMYWLSKAAEQGHEMAKKNLDVMREYLGLPPR